MRAEIDGPMFRRGARGVLAQVVVPLPILRRSDGSGNETAATVGTDVVQHVRHADRAERAFIGANACVA